MARKIRLAFVIFLFPFFLLAQEVLRGEVMVEMEPVYGAFVDEKYPLDKDDAYRRALEEAALFFSAQIYGWSFNYDIGEQARSIKEEFELTPLGEIPWGDSGLRVTRAEFRNMRLYTWMDYRPRENQLKRIKAWKTGTIRTAQAIGYAPPGDPVVISGWLSIRKAALEDAARAAVRAMLQGSERNRPKESRGFISLQSFPGYFMDSGRWACNARFLVEIKEVVPFPVY
jgi:hypothetical protein